MGRVGSLAYQSLDSGTVGRDPSLFLLSPRVCPVQFESTPLFLVDRVWVHPCRRVSCPLSRLTRVRSGVRGRRFPDLTRPFHLLEMMTFL